MRLLLVLLLTGCVGLAVRDTTAVTAGKIATARENGAIRCAPVELATAETHNDFAIHALDEGNYAQGRDAAEIAAKNAQVAIDKSPPARCNPKGEPPPPPVDVPVVDNDRDKDGIPNDQDKCPDEAEDRDGYQDADGCPDNDNDSDGLADKIDKCPNDAEDKDGFQDEDGCPDPDNDGDGVPDKDDKCPNEKGELPDGCPHKYSLVVVTETKIELKQTVFFDTNKTTIKSVSFALLDDVAQAMKDNPKITVEVQGHTDSQGDDAFNLKLSQGRAESVRTYLIKKGVSSNRMAPKGYGENMPIADNRTSDGRAENRRVEFVITGR